MSDQVPLAVVFKEPPAVPGTLLVTGEHGDVVVHLDLAGEYFCTLVLTRDGAIEVFLWMLANVLDQRREHRHG